VLNGLVSSFIKYQYSEQDELRINHLNALDYFNIDSSLPLTNLTVLGGHILSQESGSENLNRSWMIKSS